MTDSYPIVPLAWVDGLHGLNSSLEAYQELLLAWTQHCLSHGPSGDPSTFVSGLNLMFQPILDGYKEIYSQIDQAKKLGLTTSAISEAHPCPPV
jgi:hypothetical protein